MRSWLGFLRTEDAYQNSAREKSNHGCLDRIENLGNRPDHFGPTIFNNFSDEIKIRKVEMWFRKDDKAKRNQWAQEIQDHRFMIQEEVQAALQEHRTDSNVRF